MSLQEADGPVAKAPRMAASASTVYWFGVYIAVVAVALFVAPEVFLKVFWFRESPDIWLRVMAVPLFNLGIMYTAIARHGSPSVIWMTAISRAWAMVAWGALVVVGLAPVNILIFAVVDLFGAWLTYRTLKIEGRATVAA
jgi:hypothetical protein